MRKAYVDNLEPGMVLGKEVYNERGDVLLARGVVLSPRYIGALKSFGFYAVYILDGLADDVEPPDLLGERVRTATYKHVRELFNVAASAVPSIPFSQDKAGRRRPNQPSPSTAGLPNVAQLYRDVEKIIDEAMNTQVLSGVSFLKSHDSYTFEHSIEVAVTGVMLGLRLRLTQEEMNQLALGCLCHDIGKLNIPKEILHKPGPLTPEEFSIMQQHAQVGYELMREITGSADIIARNVVWQHHERQDGCGYPRGLKGINEWGYDKQQRFGQGLILPLAEIAAVAETYADLSSDHHYHKALPPAKLVATMEQIAGSHLNQEVVRRFLSILPAFPVGSEVMVIEGRLKGHRGVVTQVDPERVQQPTIRILFDPDGSPVTPYEVDTTREEHVGLASSSYAGLA